MWLLYSVCIYNEYIYIYNIIYIYIYYINILCILDSQIEKKMYLYTWFTTTVGKGPKDKQTSGTTNSFKAKTDCRTEVTGAMHGLAGRWEMEFLEQIFCQLRGWVEERLQFVFHMSLHIATPLLHNNLQPKLQVFRWGFVGASYGLLLWLCISRCIN